MGKLFFPICKCWRLFGSCVRGRLCEGRERCVTELGIVWMGSKVFQRVRWVTSGDNVARPCGYDVKLRDVKDGGSW
jgi:hypothetical protein